MKPFPLSTTLLLLTLPLLPAFASDAGSIAVHGSASATVASSTKYNYLGDTKKDYDLVVSEVTLNGTHVFENGLRAAAQLYAYELSGYKDLTLDFATVSYQFNRPFQLNAGRLKRPLGAHSTAQDVDQIRPMAFLPLDIYGKSFRPVGNAFDGASVSGAVDLGKVGSIDYEGYFGTVPGYDPETPFALSANDAAPFISTSIDTKKTFGGFIGWNTPLQGLRLRAAYMDAKLTYFGVAKTTAQMAISPSESRFLPSRLPAGLWEGSIAGKPVTSDITARYSFASAEYTWNQWQFTAEYVYIRRIGNTTLPVLGLSRAIAEQDGRYVMATYEFSDRWQFGTYYAETYANVNDRHGRKNVVLPDHRNWLKDFAAAACYNITSSWLVKAEYHRLNGTKGILSTSNGDAASWTPNWNYYVLKSTFSF